MDICGCGGGIIEYDACFKIYLYLKQHQPHLLKYSSKIMERLRHFPMIEEYNHCSEGIIECDQCFDLYLKWKTHMSTLLNALAF